MMTKGFRYQNSKYTQKDWWECLGNLHAALAVQSPNARRANVKWLVRRLHHRDTDVVHGYLLGHAKNRAGDLLALLTATLAEVEDAIDVLPGETWCLEWWQQVEVYLPFGLYSMAAKGFQYFLGTQLRCFSCGPYRTKALQKTVKEMLGGRQLGSVHLVRRETVDWM